MKTFQLLIFLLCHQWLFAQDSGKLLERAQKAFELGNCRSAIGYLEAILKVDKSNPEYFILLGKSQICLERYREALGTFDHGILSFPDNSAMFNHRGNLYLQFGEFESAVDDFTQAINLAKVDTNLFFFYANRGVSKKMMRDFEGAYQDYLMAYQYDSTEVGLLTNLGGVCDEIGRGDETLKYYFKALEIDSSWYAAYGNIGFKYQEMGQHEEAIKYFNKVLEMNPEEGLGYSNRSYNYYKLNRLEEAMADIEKSMELYPSNSYAYRIRALIYLEKGEKDQACEDIQKALDMGFTITYGEEMLELQKEHCE